MPKILQSIIKQRQGPNARKSYTGGKPDTRITENEKIKNDFEQTKNLIDYYIESSWFQDQTTSNSGNYRDMYILYDAYNTFIPEEYFNYVTNPLNSSKENHAAYPSRIRPYSIIRPNIDLLFGEYDKRPLNWTVVVISGDVNSKVEEEIKKDVISSLEQMLVNQLNEQGFDTGQQSQEAEDPAQIKGKKEQTFKDSRAIRAQNSIEKAMRELHLQDEWKRCFKDWIIVGEAYSYRGVHMDDMFYERVSPLDIDFDKSPDNEFVEDGAWVTRRKYMTPSDIQTQFWKELKEDDIDQISEMDSSLPFTSTYYNTLFGNTYRTEEDLRRTKIPVYHTVFKYLQKVGILTYQDEFGVEQEIEVAENYKVEKDRGESIEWFWIDDFWEGYRIDTSYDAGAASGRESQSVYLGVKRIENQRSMMNNMSYGKLPYNGLRYSDTHSRNISIVEFGMPYQILFQILHYKMELMVAKNKGKIALMDINAIPNKKGWDEEKFFYYAESMGFALIDRNQVGVDKTFNQYQVMDMDTFQHITQLISLMDHVKQEWDDLVGISRQRKGQTSASETATGTQTAKYQSALISERSFSRFEQFLQRELSAIVDYSKMSNIATEKEVFYRDDFTIQLLDATPEDYMEAEYGVYVSNMSKDLEDLEMLKQIIPNMSTQNADPAALMEMIQSRNVSKLRGILGDSKEKEMAAAQQAQQSEQENIDKKIAIDKEYKSIEFEFETLLEAQRQEGKESLAHIDGQYSLADTNSPGDTSFTPVDAETALLARDDLMAKVAENKEKVNIEREKIVSQEKIAKGKDDVERIKAETTLKVAKENKNKYDSK